MTSSLPICEKLRRRHVCTRHNGDKPPIVTTHHLINPDGPEAADLLDLLTEALKTTTVHLLAATSLLRKIHADVAPSKRHALFSTKLADYEKACEIGREALAKVRQHA